MLKHNGMGIENKHGVCCVWQSVAHCVNGLKILFEDWYIGGRLGALMNVAEGGGGGTAVALRL